MLAEIERLDGTIFLIILIIAVIAIIVSIFVLLPSRRILAYTLIAASMAVVTADVLVSQSIDSKQDIANVKSIEQAYGITIFPISAPLLDVLNEQGPHNMEVIFSEKGKTDPILGFVVTERDSAEVMIPEDGALVPFDQS